MSDLPDLPEPKDDAETDNFEVEVEQEAVEKEADEAPVEVEAEAEETSEEVEAEAEDNSSDNKDELDQYATGVQERISKLTYRRREAERREKAAIEYAEALKNQVEELRKQQVQNSSAVLDQFGSRLKSELESAQAAYRNAHDEGDPDALFEAQQRISRLALEQARYEEAKKRMEVERENPQQAQQAQQAPQTPVEPQQVQQEPDPKAQAWAERNTWFGEDQSMTYAAFGIHRQLVEEEGYDPSSDDYYAELDARIQKDFPSKFQKQKKAAPKQRVAAASNSASRSKTKDGKRIISLSDSQKAIARRLNVPYEVYAKEVAKLQKES